MLESCQYLTGSTVLMQRPYGCTSSKSAQAKGEAILLYRQRADVDYLVLGKMLKSKEKG